MAGSTSRPLSGRVSVVTGATSGIGLEVARGLAARGSTTVLVGRGEDRTKGVAQELARSTQNPDVFSIGVSDLALISETERVAEALVKGYPKVHILVNNAGGIFRRRDVTAEGHERTFALNVLSPFLLTSRLVPTLVESAPARVVFLSSAAHSRQKVDFDHLDLPGELYGSGWTAYSVSKLEDLLLGREFARRLTGSGVTVNAVHPGFVHSGFGLNNGGGMAFGIRFFGALFGRSVVRGADTPLFVATDPSVAAITGQYFDRRQVRSGSAESRDPTAATRLYDACRQITGAPEIPEPPSPTNVDA